MAPSDSPQVIEDWLRGIQSVSSSTSCSGAYGSIYVVATHGSCWDLGFFCSASQDGVVGCLLRALSSSGG